MTKQAALTAALLVGGVLIVGVVLAKPSKKTEGTQTPLPTTPVKPVTPIKPVTPPSLTNGVYSLPNGLEPYRTTIEWSCGQNGLRVSLFGALIERENRTFNLSATRFEAGLLLQPWFHACVLKTGTWTVQDFASSYGLTQILAVTAVCELGWSGTRDTIIQPKTNIELGARYLGKCLKQEKGSVLFALIRYNGGGAAVDAAKNNSSAHPSYEYALDVLEREKRIIAARNRSTT